MTIKTSLKCGMITARANGEAYIAPYVSTRTHEHAANMLFMGITPAPSFPTSYDVTCRKLNQFAREFTFTQDAEIPLGARVAVTLEGEEHFGMLFSRIHRLYRVRLDNGLKVSVLPFRLRIA